VTERNPGKRNHPTFVLEEGEFFDAVPQRKNLRRAKGVREEQMM